MALKTSKYGKSHARDEYDEDDEFNVMSFGRKETVQAFERREIDDEDGFQPSRKQRSHYNRIKMDMIRPARKAREGGGQA